MNPRKTLVALAALAAVAVLPLLACAEDIEGRIVGFEQAPILGGRDLVATVQTQSGGTVAVNLGPRREFRGLDLKAGDQVAIAGQFIQSGNSRIFMAERVRKGQQSVTVERNPGPNERRERLAQREVHGRVTRLRTVVVDNVKRLLADIETAPGSQVTVDVGPAEGPAGPEIRVGNIVTIHGTPSRLGEQVLVFANRLLSGERTIEIGPESRVEGRVVDLMYGPAPPDSGEFDETHLGRDDTSHLLVLLQDRNGKGTWVDFGKASDLGTFVVGLGDQVSAVGFPTGPADHSIFLARQVQDGRQVVDIEAQRAGPLEAARPET